MTLYWVNYLGSRNQNGLGREQSSMYLLRSIKLRRGKTRKGSFRNACERVGKGFSAAEEGRTNLERNLMQTAQWTVLPCPFGLYVSVDSEGNVQGAQQLASSN